MSTPDAIREIGTVIRTEDPIAVVEIPKAGACDGCAASGVCHSLGGSDIRELRAVNTIDAQPGDQVEVEVQTKAALHAALWVYAVPTLLMVGTAIVFHLLVASRWRSSKADLATAGVSLGSLALFVLIVLVWRRLRPPSLRDYPKVIRRL